SFSSIWLANSWKYASIKYSSGINDASQPFCIIVFRSYLMLSHQLTKTPAVWKLSNTPIEANFSTIEVNNALRTFGNFSLDSDKYSIVASSTTELSESDVGAKVENSSLALSHQSANSKPNSKRFAVIF